MARYDIECPACDLVFEVSKSYRDPVPACPGCAGPCHIVILNAPAYKLRGSGWAADGYRSTCQADQVMADTADKRGAIVSFPGQQNKSRIPDGSVF